MGGKDYLMVNAGESLYGWVKFFQKYLGCLQVSYLSILSVRIEHNVYINTKDL